MAASSQHLHVNGMVSSSLGSSVHLWLIWACNKKKKERLEYTTQLLHRFPCSLDELTLVAESQIQFAEIWSAELTDFTENHV